MNDEDATVSATLDERFEKLERSMKRRKLEIHTAIEEANLTVSTFLPYFNELEIQLQETRENVNAVVCELKTSVAMLHGMQRELRGQMQLLASSIAHVHYSRMTEPM